MPNINLRLTDEEHDALRTWAHDGHRSLQKEIIFRLFRDLSIPAEVVRSSAGFVTPQGREEAAKVMTGKTDLIDNFPQTAPRGVDSEWLARRAGKRK